MADDNNLHLQGVMSSSGDCVCPTGVVNSEGQPVDVPEGQPVKMSDVPTEEKVYQQGVFNASGDCVCPADAGNPENDSEGDAEPKKKEVEQSVGKPAEKKGGDKPADKTGDKETEKPADKTGDKGTEKPAEKTGDKETEKPAEKTGDKETEKPAEKKEDTLSEKLQATGEMIEKAGAGVKSVLDGAANLADKVNAKVELGEVTASVTEAKNAISTLENISFSKVIGEPLKAAIQAQSEAAKSTLSFIKEVGVKSGEKGDTMTVVTFNFIKNGRMAKMQIPLITLVPIPTMRIDKMTYKFKVSISTSSSVNLVQSNAANLTYGANATVGYNAPQTQTAQQGTAAQGAEKGAAAQGTEKGTEKGAEKGAEKGTTQNAGNKTTTAAAAAKPSDGVSVQTTFNVNFSSKKESKATQDSKYSVETGMDIAIDVVPDDMPAGISKMLEILNDSVDIYNPNGEMTVSAQQVQLSNGLAIVNVTYRDGEGNYSPNDVQVTPAEGVERLANGDSLQVLFTNPGLYLLTAGTNRYAVVVDAEAKTEETTTE